MIKLLTVALESDKLVPLLFTPTPTTVGIQLNYVPKGIIIELIEIDNGYCVKLFEMPVGQQNPKAILKALSNFPSFGEGDEAGSGECTEFNLCAEIFYKYFGKVDQQATADHVAGLLEDKKLTLGAKNGK